MAANPISVTDIVSYLTLYPWHDPEQFFTYICHLDNLYLADRAKKDEAKQKASASKAKTKGK